MEKYGKVKTKPHENPTKKILCNTHQMTEQYTNNNNTKTDERMKEQPNTKKMMKNGTWREKKTKNHYSLKTNLPPKKAIVKLIRRMFG